MLSKSWKKAKDDLVDASSEPLNERFNPPDRPASLFHFTDATGVAGILQARSLRASLAASLNDPSEVIHGIQTARNYIDGYTGPNDVGFVRSIGPLLDLSNVPSHLRIELSPYVISFCARTDRALHWLHYGRSGTGAAIEFDGNAIRKSPFDLVRVLYDLTEQTTFIESIINATATRLVSALPSVQETERVDLTKVAAYIAAGRLRAVASLMKHPAYREEEEWRLITHDVRGERVDPDRPTPLPFGYRVVAGRVVPYQDLVFDHLPATGIVLGFSSSMALDDPGLKELLKNAGLDLPIARSDVPVRR